MMPYPLARRSTFSQRIRYCSQMDQNTYCYPYARPSLTADIVCVHDGRVLLIERGAEPFAGCLALPGGFVDSGESAVQAAVRALEGEAVVQVAVARLVEVGSFTEPCRDPRGWVVSVAFAVELTDAEAETVRAGDDAAAAGWHALGSIGDLAFDHDLVLARAERMLGIVAV